MNKGFTLIELVMVIVIISILAAIAIPKFVDLQSNAKQAACDGNIATIRSSIAAYYAKTAVQGDAQFPTSISMNSFAHNYFASESLPSCPYSIDYTYTSSSGIVASHSHGE